MIEIVYQLIQYLISQNKISQNNAKYKFKFVHIMQNLSCLYKGLRCKDRFGKHKKNSYKMK